MSLDIAKLLKTVGLVGKLLVAVEAQDAPTIVNVAVELLGLYGVSVPAQVLGAVHTVVDNPKLIAAQVLVYAPLLHLPTKVVDLLKAYVAS